MSKLHFSFADARACSAHDAAWLLDTLHELDSARGEDGQDA